MKKVHVCLALIHFLFIGKLAASSVADMAVIDIDSVVSQEEIGNSSIALLNIPDSREKLHLVCKSGNILIAGLTNSKKVTERAGAFDRSLLGHQDSPYNTGYSSCSSLISSLKNGRRITIDKLSLTFRVSSKVSIDCSGELTPITLPLCI